MKYQDLISKMTLEEKCFLLSGKDFWQTRSVERLGIPSMIELSHQVRGRALRALLPRQGAHRRVPGGLVRGLPLLRNGKCPRAIPLWIRFELSQAALDHLWDGERGFFVSGAERQVSWASQVWFALAGVLDWAGTVRFLERLIAENPPIPIVTPYLYHYFIQALMEDGLTEQAVSRLKGYWGEMVRDGADTFWELYDPKDRYASPYGSRAMNSFCHAWSSTPAYFIRKYLDR